VAAVEVFNLVTGGLTWAGPVWAVLFPTVMFYIHGLRHGLGVVLSYDLAAAVILFFPGDALLTAYYPGDFKVSLMLALLSISGMSYLLEYSRATAIRQRDAAIDDLDRVAHTDTLTGLPNRRAMDEHLHLEFERYHRHRRSFCIAIADLDFFKRVNDEHGHDVGDDVLRQCATTMRTHVRDVDVVGRWGGEEFLIVMPDTDLTAATAALDRCREAVARKVFLCRDATIRVTVSIGVVRARPDHTLDRLLVEADDRLFEAKDRGRNCVVARGLSGAAPPEDVRREPRTARHHERARA
jgi:diguanylate cyclase (GGDEF)-like protein